MAIALDSTTQGGSDTYAHTVSGSDRILFVSTLGGSSFTDNITGITYNGVSMTLVGKSATSGDRWNYLFYLIAPDTGTHNVVISATPASGGVGATVATSYTGVNQTQPETMLVTSGTNTSQTQTIPTKSYGAWLVGAMHVDASPSAGSGTTSRGDRFYDSNGVKSEPSSSSYSLALTWAGSEGWSYITCSIAPADSASYEDIDKSSSNDTNYTFSSLDFSYTSSNRKIIALISGRTLDGTSSGNVLSSVTIGGVSATIAIQAQSSGNVQAIAIASVPTGTTGDVDLVFAETMENADVAVISAYGISTTATDTGSSTANTGTYDLDILAGGVAVACMKNDAGSHTATWAGLVEIYDEQDANTNDVSGAIGTFNSAQTNLTVSCTWSGTPTRPLFVTASFPQDTTPPTNTGNMFLVF